MSKLRRHRVIESRTVYSGKIVGLEVDRVEIEGREHVREVVRHPGGVVILGQLPDGRIPFVRQHRYPMDEVLLELPAGKLEPGEPPEVSAARELEEETGYRAEDLQLVLRFYSSPGFCDELLSFFYGQHLVPGQRSPEEDEFLEVVLYSLDEALQLAQSGQILDVKTLTALYWLKAK